MCLPWHKAPTPTYNSYASYALSLCGNDHVCRKHVSGIDKIVKVGLRIRIPKGFRFLHV